MFYNIGNYQEGVLSTTLTTSATQLTIQALGAGETFISPPALAILSNGRELDSLKDGEIVTVTGLSAGLTYNILRTKPLGERQVFYAGTLVLGNFFAQHLQQVIDSITALRWAVLYSIGGSAAMTHGIIRTGDPDTNRDFRVVPGATDMQVSVYGGLAMIDKTPTYRENTTLSLILPGSDTCGIFQHTDGTISYTGSFVPGTVYSDKILLAIVTTPASGPISSGAIDDERAFF